MRKYWLPAVAIVLLGGLAAKLLFSGSKLGPIAAGVVAVLPFLAYFSLTRPFVLPYAVYAMLIPFDNVLAVSSGATLTKFIGTFSAGAILLWTIGRRKFTPPSVTLWIGALLMLWMSASLLWALDLKISLNVLPTYLGLFVLYIVLSITPIERRDFVIILSAMVIGSLAAAAYGVAVFHGQSAAEAHKLTDHLGRLIVQVGDNTIDPNAYSDAIILPFTVLLAAGLRSPYGTVKLGTFAGIGLMLTAIYVSASRGAIIAISTAVLYLIIRSRYRLQILAGAALPAIVAFSTSSYMIDRFTSAEQTGGAGRVGIWTVGLEAFKQHWLTGAGIGNYRAVYDSVYIHVYQAYTGGWDRPAHNLLVQMSAELGVVGLALVLLFWVSNLFMMRHIKTDNEWYDLRIAFEAALIGLFVASLSVDLIWVKYTWLLFSSVAQLRALTIGAPLASQGRASPVRDPVPVSMPLRGRFASQALAVDDT